MLFNEPKLLKFAARGHHRRVGLRFSALQRAEIAEISSDRVDGRVYRRVSVLFNEPKLLKYVPQATRERAAKGFSALQRAEIAEIVKRSEKRHSSNAFQCSSTSRNC